MIPNRYGPLCPLGELEPSASGTAIPMDDNIDTGYKANPNDPVTSSNKVQFAIAFEDVIINSPSTNVGGIFVVQYDSKGGSGSKNDTDTIILYIPKGSPPISLKRYLGGSRFNPSMMGIDVDQQGDKAWACGVVGS